MPALSREQRLFLERATLRYHEHLSEAAEWLAGRGLEMEHASSNVLGVVRDPLPGHEHLAGRLSIPYITDAGPVHMVFRCLQDHSCKGDPNPQHAKYRFRKGAEERLYGVQSIDWAEEWIVLVEGQMDVLTWTQIGIPAVGLAGGKKWQDHWRNVFEDFSRVYCVTDGDSTGDKMWDRVSAELGTAIRVKMPDGEDTNSMYVKRGKDYLLGMIKK